MQTPSLDIFVLLPCVTRTPFEIRPFDGPVDWALWHNPAMRMPGRFDGGEKVYMALASYDGRLKQELFRMLDLPATTMCWNREGDRIWVLLSDGKDTRAWVNAALAELGRPKLPGPN